MARTSSGEFRMHIYIIAPSPVFSAEHTLDFVAYGASKPCVRVASAAITTVAAMVPPDFRITLCDQDLDPVDFEIDANVIAISANVSQADGAIEIAKRFKRLGKTVLMGGPHVSLAPHLFEDHADALVIGELEAVAERLFSDVRAGTLQKRYIAEKADLKKSPAPRWDLYPNDRAMIGVVQTSRGCPFDCHFCDVIQYLGRIQRHKDTDQVLSEIQTLYDLGYRNINLSDDNFTVYRQRTHSLLTAIADWNGADGREPMIFNTQMSIDVAKTPDILQLCNQAGLRHAFVGIESDNPASLAESRKRQNLRIDIREQCEKIVGAGIQIQGGLIVGFDNDGLDCFERQFHFAMTLPLVIFKISVLVAPVATPLYEEMAKAGRLAFKDLSSQASQGYLMTNIEPAQMTRQQLADGAKWLFMELMKPDNVAKRLEKMAALLAPAPWQKPGGDRRKGPSPILSKAYRGLFAKLTKEPDIRRLMERASALGDRHPLIREDIMDVISHYLSLYDNMRNSAHFRADFENDRYPAAIPAPLAPSGGQARQMV